MVQNLCSLIIFLLKTSDVKDMRLTVHLKISLTDLIKLGEAVVVFAHWEQEVGASAGINGLMMTFWPGQLWAEKLWVKTNIRLWGALQL